MAGLGRRGGGLATTRVIDPHWAAHHRRAAEQTMTARAVMRRRDTSSNDSDSWSPTEGRRSRAQLPVAWQGPCRLQAQPTAAQQAELAGQKVTTRTYLLSIPLDAPLPRAGAKADVFELTDCPDDPAAVGRVLRVIDVAVGSSPWERDVTVQDDLTAADRRS